MHPFQNIQNSSHTFPACKGYSWNSVLFISVENLWIIKKFTELLIQEGVSPPPCPYPKIPVLMGYYLYKTGRRAPEKVSYGDMTPLTPIYYAIFNLMILH
jgi:hypothetical protein